MSGACLDRILPLLGEDGVLGLGEPTHGSVNAFAWKLGILHELARRELLGAFALEDSLIAGQHLEAAMHGRGDLDEALAIGSSLWRTETIRAGLRQFAAIIAEARSAGDRSAAGPRILGIDVRAPQRTARALLDLGHHEPLLHAIAGRADLDPHEVEALEQLCVRLESSPDRDQAALARNLGRHIDAYLLDPDLGRLHRRDTHMAHTLLEQLPARSRCRRCAAARPTPRCTRSGRRSSPGQSSTTRDRDASSAGGSTPRCSRIRTRCARPSRCPGPAATSRRS